MALGRNQTGTTGSALRHASLARYITGCVRWPGHLAAKERCDCSTYIVILLPFECKFSMSFPHTAVGCSAVCDCVIFWSASLSFADSLFF